MAISKPEKAISFAEFENLLISSISPIIFAAENIDIPGIVVILVSTIFITFMISVSILLRALFSESIKPIYVFINMKYVLLFIPIDVFASSLRFKNLG